MQTKGAKEEDMELKISMIALFVVTLSLLCMKKIKSHFKMTTCANQPPGPSTVPIIGSLHHLLKAMWRLPLFRALHILSKQYGHIMHLKLGEVHIVVMSSPEAAKAIMKTNDARFANRFSNVSYDILSYHGNDIAMAPYGKQWRQLRKICVSELLKPSRVESFRRYREEEVAQFIKQIATSAMAGEPINLSMKLFKLFNDMIMREAFGSSVKYEEQEECLKSLNKATSLATGLTLPDLFPSSWFMGLFNFNAKQVEVCHKEIHQHLEKIIKDRREAMDFSKVDYDDLDFLGVFLRLEMEGGSPIPLTTDIITAVVFDIFAAGSETSSTTISWAMSELVRHPTIMSDAQSQVRRNLHGRIDIIEKDIVDLNCVKNIIKETLRLHSPIPLLLPRLCEETYEVMGYQIPKGAGIIINAWAINRDPQYWTKPEEFFPERFAGSSVKFEGMNFEFLPFGAGRRMCPGISLASSNMEIVLASLLFYFDWKLPDGLEAEKLDMSESDGVTATRKFPLVLQATPRCSIPISTSNAKDCTQSI